jgi:hypothetical protein
MISIFPFSATRSAFGHTTAVTIAMAKTGENAYVDHLQEPSSRLSDGSNPKDSSRLATFTRQA